MRKSLVFSKTSWSVLENTGGLVQRNYSSSSCTTIQCTTMIFTELILLNFATKLVILLYTSIDCVERAIIITLLLYETWFDVFQRLSEVLIRKKLDPFFLVIFRRRKQILEAGGGEHDQIKREQIVPLPHTFETLLLVRQQFVHINPITYSNFSATNSCRRKRRTVGRRFGVDHSPSHRAFSYYFSQE